MKIPQKELSNIKDEEIEEFEEPLAQPGKIFLAEIHGSAQRFLKIKKISKYIRFCKCCLLPSETPGVVVPYTCLDNLEDFGIGLHLYFVFIKFCIIITFIGLCLGAIPTMIFAKKYSNNINTYCHDYVDKILSNTDIMSREYEELNNTINEEVFVICINYHEISEQIWPTKKDDDIIRIDWLKKFNGDSIIKYNELYKIIQNNSEPLQDVLLDFSFIYFLTSLVLLIINFFFIHYVNLIDDKEDFLSTTPRDFTVLIQGVQRPDKNTSKLKHLENIIDEISRDYFELKLHHIIPCYNLVKLYKLTKNVYEDKIKIYHAYNFKRQKELHKIYSKQYNAEKDCFYERSNYTITKGIKNITNNSSNKLCDSYTTLNSHINNKNNATLEQLNQYNDDVYIHDENLNYYSRFLWKIKATPLNEIERRIAKNQKKIKEIEKDLEKNPDKHNSGAYFVVFKYMEMKDKFYDFFPTYIPSKIFIRIKYFFQNILFNRCVSERTKRTNYLRKQFTVYHATEAYEVIWQNMGYSVCQKTLYLFSSFFITIILIGISFGIVVSLNYVQYNLSNEYESHEIYEYLLSFLISLIISIINSLGRKLLKVVTKRFEVIETKTDYYISLSVKITIFTFINTNIVPLLSNLIHSDWNQSDILLTNILFIFILNFALNPFVFYLNPNLLMKLSKRARARKEIEGLPVKDSTYTQDELNRIFQNPSMSLCYKYSFYSNVVLTSFFYMSIIPIGIVFSLFGLIVSYFLEIAHLQFYKRPEVLNSNLCKFFINHFNIALFVFALGNFIFLRDTDVFYSPDWNLINLILFLVLIFIPYHKFKFNLLGIKEGEVTKGSYDEYELKFPTDYEKQNPLTKKAAMIRYFKKLRQMNEIDSIQSHYLINSIKKESSMANYYKTSRNVGNILNYYEFQNQFVKYRKKTKYINESKLKKQKISKYDIIINQKARERRAILKSKSSNKYLSRENLKKKININNNSNNQDINSINSSLDTFSSLQNDKNFKIIMEDNPKYRKRISSNMRNSLYQNIKDQGLYSETEENSDDDEESFNNNISDKTSKNKDNLNNSQIQLGNGDKLKEDFEKK